MSPVKLSNQQLANTFYLIGNLLEIKGEVIYKIMAYRKAVLLKQEMLFPLLGGLFLAEAFTSQIQDKIGVRWLGRRLFYRAPLHHNLQHKGIAETKVVIRLWIISGFLALLALATLKIR